MNTQNKYIEVNVRGINLKLMTYTRSLELCARMNYETENIDFIDMIKPGEVLYDLGACEGRFSIYAALKGVKVISFEPEAKNFLVFTQNTKLNNLSTEQLYPINAGVGAQNGKAKINIGQPWEGGHQKVVQHSDIRNDLHFNFVDNQEISLVALDSYVYDEGGAIPNYLKIDIDGSEIPFLKGASRVLKSKTLKGIIFELSETDPNFKSIIGLLNESGFIEQKRYNVPNESNLYNILFSK